MHIERLQQRTRKPNRFTMPVNLNLHRSEHDGRPDIWGIKINPETYSSHSQLNIECLRTEILQTIEPFNASHVTELSLMGKRHNFYYGASFKIKL